jgi:Zn finger protein HypA/HybF involved in hydrogenase expression
MRRLTNDEFVTNAKQVYADQYDYSLTAYTTMIVKVKVRCKKHDYVFDVAPVKHLSGRGCPKCKTEKMSILHKIDTTEFIKRARAVHGTEYDYTNTVYVNSATKVEIRCVIHGPWMASPNNHTSKANKCGCPSCGHTKISTSKIKTTDWFISQAKSIHGDKFDYSTSRYVDWATPISIICRIHGIFEQKAYQHFTSNVCCPQCTPSVSIGETEWLDHMNIAPDFRQKRLFINGRNLSVDAIDYRTNTIYEYYGDYWHGNPETTHLDKMNEHANATFGELYAKTLERENFLKANGYNVVAIWENDWKKLKLQ